MGLSKESCIQKDYCKAGAGGEGPLRHGEGDYSNWKNTLIRSASISRVRQKSFFFFRQKQAKLERTRCGEVGVRPACSQEGLDSGSD